MPRAPSRPLRLVQSNTLIPLVSHDKPSRVLSDGPTYTRALPKKPRGTPRSPSNPNALPPRGYIVSDGLHIKRCPYADIPPKALYPSRVRNRGA